VPAPGPVAAPAAKNIAKTAADGAAATATAPAATAAAATAPVTAAKSATAATPPAPVAAIDPENWPAVVEAAQLTGMVRQFALNCVPASFANDVLVLRLDAAAADRRTKQIDDKLVQALSKYFGRDIRVAVETAEPGLATPARQRALAEQDRSSIAAASFELDPAVRGLRERFGAEIDGSSVKPGP
jgi:hypothetical protein